MKEIYERYAKNIFGIKNKICTILSHFTHNFRQVKRFKATDEYRMSICFKQQMKEKETATSYKKDTLQKKAFPQKGFSSVFRCIRIEMITIIKSKLKIIRHICNVSLFKLKTVGLIIA